MDKGSIIENQEPRNFHKTTKMILGSQREGSLTAVEQSNRRWQHIATQLREQFVVVLGGTHRPLASTQLYFAAALQACFTATMEGRVGRPLKMCYGKLSVIGQALWAGCKSHHGRVGLESKDRFMAFRQAVGDVFDLRHITALT